MVLALLAATAMAGEGGPGGSSSDADLETAVVRTLTQLFADEDAWRVAWDDLCQHVGVSSSDEALRLARAMNTSSLLCACGTEWVLMVTCTSLPIVIKHLKLQC